MHSIRIKITAITIVAILTTVVSIFVVSYFTIRAENDRDSVEKMNLINQNTRQSLEKYFESIEQSVEMTATVAVDSLDSAALVEGGAVGAEDRKVQPTSKQRATLDAYLSDYRETLEGTATSVASHTRGIVTYYYCISPKISEKEHGYFYSRVGKTGFRREEPLDARELDPEDTVHTTWYYTPIKRGRPSWVGPYTAHFLGEIRIASYLVPIYKAGTLIGVMGMDITMDTLVDQVSAVQVYKTGFACLLDESGHIIYHPEMKTGEKPKLAGMSLDDDLLLQESNGDKLVRYKVDGEERQMSFSTLENGMKLVIVAPSDEINAEWIKMVRSILVTTILIIALFSVLLFLSMGVITRPLQRLTAASQRLANADYDVELDYKGKDEVGVLTGSFSRMRDQLKLYIEDLNRRIITDDLTGLPNMRYFFQLAEQDRERILKKGGHPVMLFINMIGMKHFNRQYGFEEGDKLICEIAEILAGHFEGETVSRFSQDHFAVVTDEADLEDRLHALFRKCAEANEGRTLPVRIGIYQDGRGQVTASGAYDRAKYACDLHRDSYNSAFYYFDEKMIRQIQDDRYIINHLDQALKEHWIEVYYQPIVRASTGRICDEEALSRWIDPERGMLSPGQFIPVLETARLIYKLDLYVLEQVLDKLHAQSNEGLPMVPQSLNLSRADFDSCDIVEEVCSRVDKAGISRDLLTIEVTESMIGDDFDFMKEQIRRFQDLGFQVWMDDFGSGYSSLEVLQDIHFDLIKIDMQFMERFEDGEESRIMLRDLIHMLGEMGLDTVCEGVETEAQVEFLKEVGCTKLQGFWYGQPVPFEEIRNLYRNGKGIGFEAPEETTEKGQS